MNTYSPGDVSLLGLGAMGAPMAQALVDADLEPWLWNRTAAKTERFADSAARIASTPAEAARPVTLTMFADLPDLEGLLDGTHGLLQGWQSAGVDRPLLVVMGTVSPAGVCRLGESLAEHGVRVMDAPVSGGVAGARERRLSIMVGGEAADVSAVEPLLRLLGTTVHHVGSLGAGQTAKTCNQIIVAATMAGVSEAFYLARSAGVRPEALLDILSGGLAASEILSQKGRNWVEESFEPGGRARYHLKDFEAARELSAEHGLSLPVTDAVAAQFERLVDSGLGDLDHSGVYRALGEQAPNP